MLRRALACPESPPAQDPPWRSQLDEIAVILAERVSRPSLRARLVRAIETEAGGSLPPAAVERLADRVAGLLAA